MSNKNIFSNVGNFFKNIGNRSDKKFSYTNSSKSKKKKNKSEKSIFRKIMGGVGKVFLTLFLIMIISGSIIATATTIYVVKDLDKDIDFDLNSLKISLTSVIYAKDSNGDYFEYQKLHGSENREWISYNEIPQSVKDAAVSVEDQRFWSHHGVDWKSTFAAFLQLFLKKDGDATRGGSTITQQLIKNITGNDQITPERKLGEIFRALELEKQYTKEEILECYLNVVSFGNGCNGIQAAAKSYFNKDASELNAAEAACIAGITKNPTKYNPLNHPEANKTRREWVLYKMNELGYLNDSEYNEALNYELEFSKKTQVVTQNKVNSYYVDQVIWDVIDDLQTEAGYSSTEAKNMIYNGGLQIYMEVDLDIQQEAEDYFKNNKNFPTNKGTTQPECAIVVMDYEGSVKAIVGGRGEKTANLVLNRATRTRRSPGSAIKPLSCYALAIETNTVEFSSMVTDEAININGYKPKNSYSKYKGDITIADAIKYSANTIPVKLVNQMGVRKSFDFMQSLGLSLIEEKVINGEKKTDIGLGSSIGSLTEGVTVLEMTSAYAAFGNGGKYYEPYTYSKVLDDSGRVILENEPHYTQVMSSSTAYIMNQLLREPLTSGGTASGSKIGSFPTFGKTGSTDDYKDRYFVGGTPYYVAGSWYGFDIPKKMSGSNYALNAWRGILRSIHKDLDYAGFDSPSGVVKKEYCTETGLLATPNCSKTKTGYYKVDSNIGLCDGSHALQNEETDTTTTTTDTTDTTATTDKTTATDKTTTTTTKAAETGGEEAA